MRPEVEGARVAVKAARHHFGSTSMIHPFDELVVVALEAQQRAIEAIDMRLGQHLHGGSYDHPELRAGGD